MFSFQRLKRFVFIGFAVLAMAAILAGCKSDTDDGISNIHGLWIASGSYTSGGTDYTWETTITINTMSKTISYSDSYDGKIAAHTDYSGKSGVIIIEYTSYDKPEYDESWNVIGTISMAGKFSAIYWSDLKPNSVRLADAYRAVEDTIFDTLAEAQEQFTMANFDYYAGILNTSSVTTYTK